MEGDLKNMAAGDVSAEAGNPPPMAAATASVEEDISPLAMASLSFPETTLEGVVAPAKEELILIAPKVEEAVLVAPVAPEEKKEPVLVAPVAPEEKKEPVVDDNANLSPESEESPQQTSSVEEEEDVEGDSESEKELLHLSTYFVCLEDRLPASAVDVIYWRQPLFSGAIFLFLFLLLLAFTRYSCISVIAHVALLVLCATISFVGFKKIAAAVQKTGDVHPFQEYLDHDLDTLFAVEDISNALKSGSGHMIFAVDVLRSLFLISNVFESIKFIVFLYALTYVGEMFNLLSIFIIALVLLFTVPKIYEVYGDDIDAIAAKLLAQAKAQWPVVKEQVVDRVMMIKDKVMAAIPVGKEKSS